MSDLTTVIADEDPTLGPGPSPASISLSRPEQGFTVDRLSYTYQGSAPSEERTAAQQSAPSEGRAKALNNLSCVIPAGSRTVLLGLNGSGKSTLMHLLAWLDWIRESRPGQIVYAPWWEPDGIDYAKASRSQQHGLRSREFGFVGQQPLMLPQLTCADNILMPLSLAGINHRRRAQRLEDVLDLVDRERSEGLRKLSKRPAYRVSGGERQLMAVLRAVVHDPAVLFADEPFNHLDLGRREAMMQLFLRWQKTSFNEGTAIDAPRTLVLVCHDLEIAAAIATHAIILRSGEAVSSRTFAISEFGQTQDQRRNAMRRLVGEGA